MYVLIGFPDRDYRSKDQYLFLKIFKVEDMIRKMLRDILVLVDVGLG